ncbi:hypothetical protein GJ629_14440 [Halapricum sp. CBA1109]|nr:hypothetical protein [Halapricum sp. CBA1109]
MPATLAQSEPATDGDTVGTAGTRPPTGRTVPLRRPDVRPMNTNGVSENRRTDTCPECGEAVRASESSERVCIGCGLVVAGPATDGRSAYLGAARHVGGPRTQTRPNRGLSTWMGSCRTDGKGNAIEGRRRRRLRRQRRRQRRAAADATSETLDPGLKEVARLCSVLELAETVRETASVVFRRALSAGILQGWAYESIAAGSVLIAARRSGAVRSLSAVVTASRRPRRRVARALRHLQRELDLAVEPPDVVEFLPAVGDTLSVEADLLGMARQLLEAATAASLHSGRDPQALAASAVYTVTLVAESAPPLCQTEVAEAVGVSPPTLRRQFRALEPLCPDVFDVAPADIDDPKSRAGRRTDRTTPGTTTTQSTGAD